MPHTISHAQVQRSKVVLRNGHFWAVLQPFHQVAQTQDLDTFALLGVGAEGSAKAE